MIMTVVLCAPKLLKTQNVISHKKEHFQVHSTNPFLGLCHLISTYPLSQTCDVIKNVTPKKDFTCLRAWTFSPPKNEFESTNLIRIKIHIGLFSKNILSLFSHFGTCNYILDYRTLDHSNLLNTGWKPPKSPQKLRGF